MKKPFEDEIVKGTDTSGRSFSEGRVTSSSSSKSEIKLPDGSNTSARNRDIQPQMDMPNYHKKV